MAVPENKYGLYPKWMLWIQDEIFKTRYGGTTLWPFVIYVSRLSKLEIKRFKRHEGYHWSQQKWLLGVGFYIIYGVEYGCYRLIKGMTHDQAYRNLAAEQEAYLYENDEEYPETRSKYGWLKYIFTKPLPVR